MVLSYLDSSSEVEVWLLPKLESKGLRLYPPFVVVSCRTLWRCDVLSHVQLFATSWTVACQAPLSMGFPRQEYWSGLPFPSPGELPQPRDGAHVCCLLHSQAGSLTLALPGKCRGSYCPSPFLWKLHPVDNCLNLTLKWQKTKFKLPLEFSSSPVVRTRCFHCWDLGSIPG